MTAQPTASSATGTRERIIATALELESRGSSAHLTLKTLAKALDLHYTALYYHFKSMDDLRAALVEHLATQRSEHLALARDMGTSAFDQLIAFIKLELHQPPTRLLTTVASHRIGGEPGHRARRAIRAQEDELAALIETGKGDGSIRPCDPAMVSRIINHIMGRYANQHEQLFEQAHFDADFLTQTVVDFVANGIIAPGVDPALLGNGPAAPMRPLAGSPSSSFEKIVCTLSAHFNRQGYRGTSIPKVARSIGLSKTSFYKYAASKEELLYLCVQHSMRLVAESRQLAVAVTDNPLAALLHLVYYDRFLNDNPPGPYLSVGLYDSLSSEHAEVAWDFNLVRRWETINLLEQCAAAGLTRGFDARALQPMMVPFARIPLQSGGRSSGYQDEATHFILHGIAA